MHCMLKQNFLDKCSVGSYDNQLATKISAFYGIQKLLFSQDPATG
jgi:hypothetical protein